MSKGIDIQLVRENYQRLSDDELIRIVTQDAVGLTPEALEVIKDEIRSRKLNIDIIKGIEAQNKSYTIEEIDSYCEIVRNLNCPSCGTTGSKLNATVTSEVVSFVLFTQRNKKLKIGCPDCLDKANSSALTNTLLLGWWGIPWGIIWTIQATNHNIKSKKTHRISTPNEYLRGFALANLGQLETYKNDKEKLQQIISS